MEHHRTFDSHDRLDHTFRDSIMMMGSDSRVPDSLAVLLKVLGEGLRGEGRAVVERVLCQASSKRWIG
jgi:hypothetical protein